MWERLTGEQEAELRSRLHAAGLGAVADTVVNAAVPAFAVVAAGKDAYAEAGNTRFGGVPDLPADLEWPRDPEDLAAPHYVPPAPAVHDTTAGPKLPA
jgi:hypothetical protein